MTPTAVKGIESSNTIIYAVIRLSIADEVGVRYGRLDIERLFTDTFYARVRGRVANSTG